MKLGILSLFSQKSRHQLLALISAIFISLFLGSSTLSLAHNEVMQLGSIYFRGEGKGIVASRGELKLKEIHKFKIPAQMDFSFGKRDGAAATL